MPDPLPRGVALPPGLVHKIGATRTRLGRLGEGLRNLPSPDLFLRPFQTREAVLSSRIEGTRTTLEQALVQEATSTEEELVDDDREVSNYGKALRAGVAALGQGRPLTVYLLKDLHRELLRGARGQAVSRPSGLDRVVRERARRHARAIRAAAAARNRAGPAGSRSVPFVDIVAESSTETLDRLHRLRALREDFAERLRKVQSQKPALLVPELFGLPYLTVPIAKAVLEVESATAQQTITRLVKTGILELMDERPIQGRGRPPKLYRCSAILEIIRE